MTVYVIQYLSFITHEWKDYAPAYPLFSEADYIARGMNPAGDLRVVMRVTRETVYKTY